MFSVLTVKQEQCGRKYFLSLFSLQIIFEDAQRKKGLTDAQTRKHRERELKHEYTHKTQITPHLSQAPASPAKLRSRQPTAQITRQPNTQDPQTPVHPDLSLPFPHHRSTSPIASHASMSSDLNNRPQVVLHQALQRTGCHHRSSIWPPSTTSPLHSTPKPTRSNRRRLHPL